MPPAPPSTSTAHPISTEPDERLSLAGALRIASRVLTASGATAENAAAVADSIVAAEAQGLSEVGFDYLPVYCRHLEIGRVDGRARPSWRRAAPAAVIADAAAGFSQPAFVAAFDELVDAAKTNGIAALTIIHSYPAGMLGWFVEHLARRDLMGLAFANAGAAVAPWGGRVPLFGTNPLAFAAPRHEAEPLVIDLATSAVARVKVKAAAEAGRPIPADWAFDCDGRPTTDATAALAGSLAPLGGPKGYALGLMVEMLAAGLTGMNWSHEAPAAGSDTARQPRLGQTIIAISPKDFGGTGLAERIGGLALVIEEAGARLPGVRRHQTQAEARRDGLRVTPAISRLMKCGASSW